MVWRRKLSARRLETISNTSAFSSSFSVSFDILEMVWKSCIAHIWSGFFMSLAWSMFSLFLVLRYCRTQSVSSSELFLFLFLLFTQFCSDLSVSAVASAHSIEIFPTPSKLVSWLPSARNSFLSSSVPISPGATGVPWKAKARGISYRIINLQAIQKFLSDGFIYLASDLVQCFRYPTPRKNGKR